MTAADIARFNSKIDKTLGYGPWRNCWIFKSPRSRKHDAYGSFWFEGRTHSAHKIAFRIAHPKMKIPFRTYICHKCDIRLCVNPDHLFRGTGRDNMKDASRKGRLRTKPKLPKPPTPARNRHWLGDGNPSRRNPKRLAGMRHPRAKLTSKNVRIIRRRYAAGESQGILAREFHVDQTLISRIVLFKNRKHD